MIDSYLKSKSSLEDRIHLAFSNVIKPDFWGVDNSNLYLNISTTIFDEYTESTLAFKKCNKEDINYNKLKKITYDFNDQGSLFSFLDPIVFHWILPNLLLESFKINRVGIYIYRMLSYKFVDSHKNLNIPIEIYTSNQIEIVAEAINALHEKFSCADYVDYIDDIDWTSKLISDLLQAAQKKSVQMTPQAGKSNTATRPMLAR